MTFDFKSNLKYEVLNDLSFHISHCYHHISYIYGLFCACWLKEVHQTDHGPKVVGHLLAILQDSPEEEVPPGVFAALLQLRQVLLAVEQSTLGRLFLEDIGPMTRYHLINAGFDIFH